MDDETEVNTRIQEHDKQEERKFQHLRQTLEEENRTRLLALEPPSEEYPMHVRDLEKEAETTIRLNARFQEELRGQQIR